MRATGLNPSAGFMEFDLILRCEQYVLSLISEVLESELTGWESGSVRRWLQEGWATTTQGRTLTWG